MLFLDNFSSELWSMLLPAGRDEVKVAITRTNLAKCILTSILAGDHFIAANYLSHFLLCVCMCVVMAA